MGGTQGQLHRTDVRAYEPNKQNVAVVHKYICETHILQVYRAFYLLQDILFFS